MELFLWICTKFSKKNDNYEEFLTKFVNINNHTYHFLHGVLILQDAKNCSQHEDIFEAWQKKSRFAGQIKRAIIKNLRSKIKKISLLQKLWKYVCAKMVAISKKSLGLHCNQTFVFGNEKWRKPCYIVVMIQNPSKGVERTLLMTGRKWPRFYENPSNFQL